MSCAARAASTCSRLVKRRPGRAKETFLRTIRVRRGPRPHVATHGRTRNPASSEART